MSVITSRCLLFFSVFILFTLMNNCAATEGTVVESNRGEVLVGSPAVDRTDIVPGTFAGGKSQLTFRYPEDCYNMGIEGAIEISFDLQDTGELTNARVTRGIGGGCDEAALEAIRNSEFSPAMDLNGNPIPSRHTVQIIYRL